MRLAAGRGQGLGQGEGRCRMQGRATVVAVLAQEVPRGQRLGQGSKRQGRQQSMAICLRGLLRLLGFPPLPLSRCRRCRPCPSECTYWWLEVGASTRAMAAVPV